MLSDTRYGNETETSVFDGGWYSHIEKVAKEIAIWATVRYLIHMQSSSQRTPSR